MAGVVCPEGLTGAGALSQRVLRQTDSSLLPMQAAGAQVAAGLLLAELLPCL